MARARPHCSTLSPGCINWTAARSISADNVTRAASRICWRKPASRAPSRTSPVRQHECAGKHHGRPSPAHAHRYLGALTRNAAARTEERDTLQHARELLEYVGINSAHQTLAKHLSYGEQRRLEIARALAHEPKLLALDEPAAEINATETVALKALLQKIRASGITVLLIEHDVKLIMGLCIAWPYWITARRLPRRPASTSGNCCFSPIGWIQRTLYGQRYRTLKRRFLTP